ncbi:PKD domain-containing protein [Pricia antarctica]|uniref:PKD domain-containing protein n=1 Tax=Pricia antarctica TaxID=641691 RepID=A0A1G6YQK3_9FLAO|nr:PKD domain-containing protein [Pricia antarctica]SDD92668.1 PKD domain-containing protein [Pricia antarctica]
MNLRSPNSLLYFLCFIAISLLLNISCNNDMDMASDAVLNEQATYATAKSNLELKTTVFPVTQDAYLQSGRGHNKSIVRLEENSRKGYLMFDLSKIDNLSGKITSARLEFIIDSDPGYGRIEVFEGDSNNWKENSLSNNSAPNIENQLGSVQQVFPLYKKVRIDLNADKLLPELNTLILRHSNGNDLAFASKENAKLSGSQLVVTYSVTTGSGSSNTGTNKAPNAVATASTLTGKAPLQVDFTGSNSSDDKGVVGHSWDFQGGSSSSANTTHTFDNPGIYDVTLTVTDAEGLIAVSKGLKITVNEAIGGNTPCNTDGGRAGETGLKLWCVDGMENPLSGSFANGDLKVDKDGSNSTIPKENGRIKFNVTPDGSGNKRAEIRTAPWNVKHTLGTEEWFGWSYTFGNDYVIDQNSQWKFFQVHNGVVGESPQIGLEIINKNQFGGHGAGEIYVTNSTTSQNYNATGITPRAGQTLDIVVHAIWHNAANGLLQVWINGTKVYDKQVSTVFASHPWAGNAKWGIYKWPWSSQSNVQKSVNQGIRGLTTYMGNLKIITKRPGDPDYGSNSYSRVVPD